MQIAHFYLICRKFPSLLTFSPEYPKLRKKNSIYLYHKLEYKQTKIPRYIFIFEG